MRALMLTVVTCCALSVGPAFAAEGQGKQPFELVRELQVLQDRKVLKSSTEGDERQLIETIGAQMLAAPAAVWSEPKNGRAAVIYVLSGGDPRVLRKLIGSVPSLAVDDRLVKAALAYGELQDDKARELFDELDVEMIDQSIIGHVSLVHALVIADKEPQKALALLGMARIMSAGTIVEEAALRRNAILSAKTGDLVTFEQLSSQYLRRFPDSRFAGNFRQQFAREIVTGGYAADEQRLARLKRMLDGLDDAERREACLALAEEAVVTGNVRMVRFAAEIASELFKDKPADATRLRLFEAAALVLTKDVEDGLAALSSIKRSQLTDREIGLLHAAVAVGRQVTLPPSPPKTADLAPPASDVVPADAGSKEITHAQDVLSRVDKMLSEATR